MGESWKEVPGRADGSLGAAALGSDSPTITRQQYYFVLYYSWGGLPGRGVYYKCIIMGGRVAGICIACVQTTGSIGSPTQANMDNSLELFSTRGRGQVFQNIDKRRNQAVFAGDENVETRGVSYVSREDAD